MSDWKMTEKQTAMVLWLTRMHYLSEGTSWYRAASHGERVTLASLHGHGVAERRARRGNEGEADAAYEYRIATVILDAVEWKLTAEQLVGLGKPVTA